MDDAAAEVEAAEGAAAASAAPVPAKPVPAPRSKGQVSARQAARAKRGRKIYREKIS